ncbi:hypothetical protein BpHYR1_006718 [Brachionus plicatilis]|uniref:Uncharacterized protein n=1 Tax=Brachionus plicatilis TaxID=10195 RepID=A0A3M7RRR4_BRAPC|nr:hypothetical protein BpHYR1_006718 [Brachionus plicatilis]
MGKMLLNPAIAINQWQCEILVQKLQYKNQVNDFINYSNIHLFIFKPEIFPSSSLAIFFSEYGLLKVSYRAGVRSGLINNLLYRSLLARFFADAQASFLDSIELNTTISSPIYLQLRFLLLETILFKFLRPALLNYRITVDGVQYSFRAFGTGLGELGSEIRTYISSIFEFIKNYNMIPPLLLYGPIASRVAYLKIMKLSLKYPLFSIISLEISKKIKLKTEGFRALNKIIGGYLK